MLYCTFTVLYTDNKYSATLLSLLPIASKGWEYSTKINFPTILLNTNYFYPPTKKKKFLHTFLHTSSNLQTFLHICEIIKHFRKHFRSCTMKISTQNLRPSFLGTNSKTMRTFSQTLQTHLQY